MAYAQQLLLQHSAIFPRSPAPRPVDLMPSQDCPSPPHVEFRDRPSQARDTTLIFPRRKVNDSFRNAPYGKASLPAVAISKDLLVKFYGVPLPEVAKALGVGSTALKAACRRLGIKRWPCAAAGPKKQASEPASEDVEVADLEDAQEEDLEMRFEEDLNFLSRSNFYFNLEFVADLGGLRQTSLRSDLAFVPEAGVEVEQAAGCSSR